MPFRLGLISYIPEQPVATILNDPYTVASIPFVGQDQSRAPNQFHIYNFGALLLDCGN